MLLPKIQSVLEFYQTFSSGPFRYQGLVQDPTLHWVVCLVSLSLWALLSHDFDTGELFCTASLKFIFVISKKLTGSGCAFLPRLSQKCNVLHSASFQDGHDVDRFYFIGNVNLDYLLKVVSTTFLHCKVVIFPFYW